MRRSRALTVVAVGWCFASLLAACGSTLTPTEAVNTGALVDIDTIEGGGGAAIGAGDPLLGGGASDDSGSGSSSSGGSSSGAGTSRSSGTSEGASASDGGAGSASQEGDATGDVKAGSCDGFQEQTGIDEDTITLANASDVSGPIPGLFESAQQGVKAYVAFFNSTSDICGRKLEVDTYDSRTDSGGDQEAALRACDSAFAMVGSMSAFDNGGARAVRECGIPDIRTATVAPERGEVPSVFGTQSTRINLIPTAVPQHLAKIAPAGRQAMAIAYTSSAGAVVAGKHTRAVFEKNGYKVIYDQQIDSTEFNYSPYVLEMKNRGVKAVLMIGAYQHTVRLAQAMEQQGFEPDAYLVQPSSYDVNFLSTGRSAVEGAYVYTDSGIFERPTPELTTYTQWLQKVAPGEEPTYFGQYAWGATRLFVERAIALGGDLTRASLVKAMEGVKGYTSNGMFAPQQVGANITPECTRFLQVRGGKFVQVSPGDFMCQGLTDSGIQ